MPLVVVLQGRGCGRAERVGDGRLGAQGEGEGVLVGVFLGAASNISIIEVRVSLYKECTYGSFQAT